MPDTVHPNLSAYLDGELDPRAQNAVQAHLSTCPACQDELADLRRLSHLLRAAPRPAFTPTRDFQSRLMLQLPRRAAAPRSSGLAGALPWLVPGLVLAGWIFIQVTLGLSGLVSLAAQAGLLDGATWAASAPQQTLWAAALQATFGGLLGPQAQAGLQVASDAGLLADGLVTSLLWQAGVALFYAAALALLWRTHFKAPAGSLERD